MRRLHIRNCVSTEIESACCLCGGGITVAPNPTRAPSRSPLRSPRHCLLATPLPTPLPTFLPTPLPTPLTTRSPTPWPTPAECTDGVLDPSRMSWGPWTCDSHRSLSETDFCHFGERDRKCCRCGGGTNLQASATPASCVDCDLTSHWRVAMLSIDWGAAWQASSVFFLSKKQRVNSNFCFTFAL